MIEIGAKTTLELPKRLLLGFRQQNLSSSSCDSMDDLSANSGSSRCSGGGSSENAGVRRSVAFDSIEILEFPIELGDNPAVRVERLHLSTRSRGTRALLTLYFFVCFLLCYLFTQVHEGPPIQIGWKHHKRNVMELDVYEVFRTRRRGRRELPISMNARTAT